MELGDFVVSILSDIRSENSEKYNLTPLQLDTEKYLGRVLYWWIIKHILSWIVILGYWPPSDYKTSTYQLFFWTKLMSFNFLLKADKNVSSSNSESGFCKTRKG